MQRLFTTIATCALGLTACGSPTESFTDPCEALIRKGEPVVVIEPPIGLFGIGASTRIGEALQLSAAVRPITGAATDFLGGGGCELFYGDSLPAVIEWRSSDPEVAQVDQQGGVLGRSEGVADIAARAPTHGIEATRQVSVWP